MSSGLPVNTFSQAKEYRKQYMASLALEAQNDAFNLMANQVYKQTGQPSRPPDTRTTTEKIADTEQLKVEVLNKFMEITDGQMASEAANALTADELVFTAQMMPTIIAEIKPKFARGIPSQALLSYIRALRRKELATNGVSFTAQEATAQSILNALQAGRAIGAPLPPFAPPVGAPEPPLTISQPLRLEPSRLQRAQERIRRPDLSEAILQRTQEMGILPEEVEMRSQRAMEEERGMLFQRPGPQKQTFNSLPEFYSLSWEKVRKWYDDWAQELPEVASLVPVELIMSRGPDAGRLKTSLPGSLTKTQAKQQMTDAAERYLLFSSRMKEAATPATATSAEAMSVSGLGMRPRALAPASRFPTGRSILGYGLKRSGKVSIDMSQGIKNTAPTYVPFGKFIINPSKLSRGIFEVRTLNGGKMGKYPDKELSPSLTKIMRRMLDDRMPDEYDFNEMDLEDQNFLFNLSKDAKINDRLNIPTPKLSKEGEEMNRFEILKGQIVAGNDNKELVKEFKQMLLKFSNDGRIKKNEAREILMDLTALGY